VLLVVREASLDVNPHWVVLELTINASVSQSSTTSAKRLQVNPLFLLPSKLEPEWIRMSPDRRWLLLERQSDRQMVLMELDAQASDYNKAVGSLNGKF